MPDSRPRLLTDEQRLWLTSILPDLTDFEIHHHYTLSMDDIRFIQQHRGPANRLGIAIQLCGLRYPGRRLLDLLPIPENVLTYIAVQLGIDPARFHEYGRRPPTIYEHLEDIRQTYGYRDCAAQDLLPLARYLLTLAMESEESLPLVQAALHYMRGLRLIPPGITSTESLVWRVQRTARRHVYGRLTRPLSASQNLSLDQLLQTDSDRVATSPFGWLRLPVGKPSPDSIYHLLDRLAYIHELNLPSPPDSLHPNRVRQLAEQARHYKAQQVTQFPAVKRRAFLVAYLYQLTGELTDQLLDMFDRSFADLMRRGRNAQKHHLYRNVAKLNRALNSLTLVAEAFLQARQNGEDPVAAILDVIDEPALESTVAVARAHMRPPSMDYRDLLQNRYRYRRRKALMTLYRSLSFVPVGDNHPALDALEHVLFLQESFNERVTAVTQTVAQQELEAPLAHLKHTRWKRHAVSRDGRINPNYYEMGAWHQLRAALRAGDIAVTGSQRYQGFEEYLLSPPAWETLKEKGETRLAVTDDPDTYLNERQRTIETLVNQLPDLLAEAGLLSADDDGLHLSPAEKSTPDEVDEWGRRFDQMMPETQLADVVIEVDRWTHCLDEFSSLVSNQPAQGILRQRLIAAILATGMNLDLTQMAQATEFSVDQLTQVADGFIREDTVRAALTTLDNFVLHHPYSRHWGQGTSSSSDGMRLVVPVSSPNALYNARYFHFERGVTIVTHAADIWMPFDPVIPGDANEALHVIDALCHHETDFDIQEHYTDTGGYTYHVFALCHLLGFRFSPRIRNVTDQYLFTVEPVTPPDAIAHLLKEPVDCELIRRNWDTLCRLAASIRHGKVSASLIMRKLAAYPRQNELAQALNEIGKLERTVFVLQYWQDETMQQRIRRGLNKGETVFRLARALAIGQQGELRERDLYNQMNRASCLMLMVAMIGAWNTVYLDRAVHFLREKGDPPPDEYLAHISPLRWKHINFLGRYEFDLNQAYSLDNLRPLRQPAWISQKGTQ
jgi:TnpA family transposase